MGGRKKRGLKCCKKALCVILSVIIAFGTLITLTFGNAALENWLGIKSMMSAYAAEIVDTKGAVAVNESAMTDNNTIIDLEYKDGTNTAYVFSEPITYVDENGNIKAKDISVEKQSDKELKQKGYDYTNGQNDYRIHFSTDSDKGLYIEVGDNRYSIIPLSDKSAVGEESTSLILNERFEDFEYKNIYGDGTNLKFYPQLNGVKDEIVLNQNINKNTFSFEIKAENCSAQLNEDGTVSVVDENRETIQTFSAPYAYDSVYVDGDDNNHRTNCEYALEDNGNHSYTLTVQVPTEWLDHPDTVYPVIIDPTTINVDTFRDAGIYSKKADICYGSEETACIGKSSEYGNGRVYLQFLWPSEIKSYAKINSAFVWMRETTGRTSDMYVQPYMVRYAWKEGTITWNNRAYMDDTSDMPTKNINSQSTDWASSPYWYKMHITSAVQKWTNGERNNYGIGLYTTDEEKSTYNWRAFATIQHSTSSYKPYTVISYTNDETAPTATVKASTTEWTNGNVTLTADAAKDNTGGSGLHATAYSFSTTKGTYNWQASNSKTFSSNSTVYVSVRDAASNIRTYTFSFDNIDKIKPTYSELSGIPDEWTNEDVTLTIKGAADGESGLDDKAYSFSTAENVYAWQESASKTFNDNCTIYAYIRDKAGNITSIDPVTISKIDKDAPVTTGGTDVDNTDGWVTQVTVTANARDTVSGLHAVPYSFSTVENEYNWQEENYKIITQNETIYVYARDNAGNVTLLDTIVIDNIDAVKPVIHSVDSEDKDGQTTVTVSATDNETGIAGYSFDYGATWQESNTFTFETDTLNYVRVLVKDKAGNTDEKQINFYLPQIYYEDNMVGIYNPNPKCEQDIYFIMPHAITSSVKYDGPVPIPIEDRAMIRAWFDGSIRSTTYIPAIKLNTRYNTFFNYKEACEDYKINYKDISFRIARNFNNGDWDYSFDTSISVEKDGALIRVGMPDFTNPVFIRQNKYTYYNESKKYELSVIYDDNDKNVMEYIVKAGNLSYYYNTDGDLTKIADNYNNCITITKSDNCIRIKDDTERTCKVNLSNGKITSIIDFSGNAITYEYDGNLLSAVKDQTGVVIGSYEYADGKITKSNGKTIAYDGDKVSKITAENGAYVNYDCGFCSITVEDSTGKKSLTSYNYLGMITSYIDDYDIYALDPTDYKYETEYTYDNAYQLVSVKTGDTVTAEYTYDDNGNVISKKENDTETFYSYDEQNKLIRTQSGKNYEYYVYDEFGNVVISATLKSDYSGDIPAAYDSTLDCFDVVKSTYQDGLLTEQENVADQSKIIYDYDACGNNIKTTSVTQKEDAASLSVTEYTYDLSGNLLTSTTDDSVTAYTYDKAGRIILIDTDGNRERTIYDNKGRVVQSIDSSQYKAECDGLPNSNTYSDKDAGHIYTYDNKGNLINERNKYGIVTTYDYSDVGNLEKKHFDLYDYYYNIDGSISNIDVDNETVINYKYDVTIDSLSKKDDQQFNQIEYANGYTETQLTDSKGNLLAIYNLNHMQNLPYYNIKSATENSISTQNLNCGIYQTITSNDEYTSIEKKAMAIDGYADLQLYKISSDNNITTIEETNHKKNYQTIINENQITFNSAENSILYKIDNNDSSAVATISNGETVSLSAEYTSGDDFYQKSYLNGKTFANYYDDKGNIISDERNAYTYDSYGQLLSVSGENNSSYTYDDRGNMLTKNVDGALTTYGYDNGWKDQLTSVNDTQLTYDENGNLLTYGDMQYEWNCAHLSKITDSENEYLYLYNENGIRESKIINGEKIRFNTVNGAVVAQSNNNLTDTMYFQYSNGVPVGFIHNDTQYLYITNLSGDVVGITDIDGNLIAEYTYDEWGKLLEITTAQENNAEQLALAELNPLRYRGYYYDSETGLYYLQSRYYNPEIGRFISSDSFDYINTSSNFNLNGYIYCLNCPTAYIDINGETPQLAINWAALLDFGLKIKDKLVEKYYELAEKFNDFADKCANIYSDVVNFFVTLPDRFSNYFNAGVMKFENTITNSLKQVSAYFRSFDFKFTKIILKFFEAKNEIEKGKNGISLYSSKSKDNSNVVSEVGKIIGVIITEIFTCLSLEKIASDLGIDFSFNNLFEYMQLKTKIFRKYFDSKEDTASKDVAVDISGILSTIVGFNQNLQTNISVAFSLLPYIINMINDYSGRYLSMTGALIVAAFDLGMGLIFDIGGAIISSKTKLPIGGIFSFLWGEYSNNLSRDKLEFIAYNWYYLQFIK